MLFADRHTTIPDSQIYGLFTPCQSHRVGNPVVEVTLFVAAVVVVVGLFSSEYDEEENRIILEHKIIYNVVCRSG